MKETIEKILKKVMKKGNSASFIFITSDLDEQLKHVEIFTKKILNIPSNKSYKTNPDCYGIWPENIDKNKIKLKQIQEYIRKSQLKPFNSVFKVGIIVSAEKMTHQAQNALLKTLEEPPSNTFLLLSAANENKLLKTIRSRCQILDLTKKGEKLKQSENVTKILKADLVDRFKFVETLLEEKDPSVQSEMIELFLKNLLETFRKALIKKQDSKNLIKILNLIQSTQNALERNVNKRLALENLMINLPLKNIDF